MNIGDLLGSVMQSGMSRSSTDRLRGVLGELERSVGGRQNLALGGLGALVGALAGGRRGLGGAVRGGLGGGAMALLGLMAYQALQKGGAAPGARAPAGGTEPTTPAERAELELNAGVVLKAMINAAKADGAIDEAEVGRMVGKVQEYGADRWGGDFLKAEMQKPMDTGGLVAAARGNPGLAAQVYAASLLAIEVDTPAEREYLAGLAAALGLAPAVVAELHRTVGIA